MVPRIGSALYLWALWIAAGRASAVDRAPVCGSSIEGEEGACKQFVVDPNACKASFANAEVLHEALDTPGSEGFTLRAVYYVPRVIGVDPAEHDIYSYDFTALHKRDLYIIKTVLKANAIRLEPWIIRRSNDHVHFMRLVKEMGLFVIPTFDLAHYVKRSSTRSGKTSGRERSAEMMEKDFSAFLQHLGPDEPVLFWAVNHGLYINETVPSGRYSLSLPNPKRFDYFYFLDRLRSTHHSIEWNEQTQRYNRPLALPLMLDTYNKLTDINWFMKFAEHEWDTWHTRTTDSPHGTSLGLGSFDIWLIETQALLEAEAITALKTMRIYENEPDDEDCDESTDFSASDCGYSTSKAIVMQYGSAALYRGEKTSQLRINVHEQQKFLKDVWEKLVDPQSNRDHCLRGGIIDEWADDWDRCGGRGFADTSSFIHDIRGLCSMVRMTTETRLEWFGLNGQYSSLFRHCIDPRYKDPSSFRFVAQTAEESMLAWKQSPSGLCVFKRPPTWKVYRFLACLFAVLLIAVVRWRRIRSKEKLLDAENAKVEMEGPRPSRAPSNETLSETGGNSPTPRKTQHNAPSAVEACAELRVPAFFGDERSFTITLELKNAQGKAAMSKDQVHFVINAHALAQERRLAHQVTSEAYAVQDKSRLSNNLSALDDLELSHDQAMRNIHSKALEGYVAWLADQAKSRRNCVEHRNEMLDNSKRRPWELWIEALLLRTVESLSEQLLHSPELVHAIYHRVRQPGERPWSRDAPSFTIDYKLLHRGLEALNAKPNPYVGGLNFDDLNDCGRLNDPDLTLKKTYQESVGLFVIIDILSNFLPTICVKFWIFFLAWYVHMILKSVHEKDARNGTFFSPTYKAGNTIQIFGLMDAIVGFCIETLILFQGIRQGRLRWVGRNIWLLRHGVSLLVTASGFAILYERCDFQSIEPGVTLANVRGPKPEALHAVFGYWCVRVVTFVLMNQRMGITGFILGTPANRNNPEVPGVMGMGSSAAGQAEMGQEGSESQSGIIERRRVKAYVEQEDTLMVKYGRVLLWVCMLGLCFIFEVFWIAPLATEFDMGEFCDLSCKPKESLHSHASEELWRLLSVGNDCWACRGTLCLTWILVFLTGFFDMYYCFYFGTSIVGYAMGEARGLRNVLATTLRYLDFNTHSTSTKILATKKKQLTDGELMARAFGTSWRLLWSRLVDSLYEECLISAKQRDGMVRAAGTMVWAKRKGKENLKPSDTFEYLKFTSVATRGSNRVVGADVGQERTKCISGLLVREEPNGQALTLMVPQEDYVTKEIHLDGFEDRNKVQEALLTDNKGNQDLSILELISAVDVVSRGETVTLKQKWRLLGACDLALPGATSEAEVLDLFQNLDRFPAKILFRTSSKYNECMVKLERPCRIHSLSWIKTSDDPAMDPVQWRVEGLQPVPPEATEAQKKENQWKQLVWQESTLEPKSRGRGEPIEEWFKVECWRQKGKGASTLDLNDFPPVVAERLGFLTASLNGILLDPMYPVHEGVDTLMDSHIGNVPSLSQIIPVYGETVIIDEKSLSQSDGVNTNLGFLVSQFADEWGHFSRKMGWDPRNLYRSFVSGTLIESKNTEDKDLIMEVRLWASMRSQTVSRTVVGAIQYHEVLSLMPGIQATASEQREQEEEGASRDALERSVELILAHQTYGQKRKDDKPGPAESDKDVNYLLKKYADRPFYLVLDYNDKNAEAGLRNKVQAFALNQHRYKGKVQFCSVLARWQQGSCEDGLEIVSVMPRRFSLLLGEGDFRTQGKAGNQLGALRFARGHYLQMMDSNMGAFLGEACKVPFVTRRFCPYNHNRAGVTARIIGFREFIFTEAHGTVGNIMASAEFSFGTICQRFLAGLGARMHYGHPDFLDGFWASNRGSLSKASPAVNLSEDIFAGFNVAMRSEKSKHVDTLAWEKGREASFNSSSLFFSKVSGGNAGVMRSRDLKIISENLSITENFSFFFASIGFYFNNLLIDFSVMLYVLLFVLLTLCSKSLIDVGDMFSMLASEWVCSLGIVAMMPRFFELILEYGPLEGILRFVPSVPACMTMFTFINKSVAMAVKETMITGKAHYISTGRPNANTHYGWRECYFIFCKSHYYPAISVNIAYLLYYLLARTMDFDSLPMMVLMGSVWMWIVVPIIFCPQPTLRTLVKDLCQFWQFCIATPEWSVRKMPLLEKNTEDMLHSQMGNSRSTLYEYWLVEELKKKQESCSSRLFQLAYHCVKLLVLLSVIHTSMLDHAFNFLGVFVFLFLLTELWRLLYRPTALILIVMFANIFIPLWFYRMRFLDFLLVWITFMCACALLHDLFLMVAGLVYKPDSSWPKWETGTEEERKRRSKKRWETRQYDIVVEYFYVSFHLYYVHLYCSLFILAANFCTQLPMILLDAFGGLHSALLLNSNLSGHFGFKRVGYEPPPVAAEEETGARRKSRARGSLLNTLAEMIPALGRSRGSVSASPEQISMEMQQVSSGMNRRPAAQQLLG